MLCFIEKKGFFTLLSSCSAKKQKLCLNGNGSAKQLRNRARKLSNVRQIFVSMMIMMTMMIVSIVSLHFFSLFISLINAFLNWNLNLTVQSVCFPWFVLFWFITFNEIVMTQNSNQNEHCIIIIMAENCLF